jgi:AraC family transcriptional regulator
MLTYSLASNVARRPSFDQPASLEFTDPRPMRSAKLLRIDSRFEDGGQRSNGVVQRFSDLKMADTVEAISAHLVTRRAAAWDGIKAEVIQSVTHDRLELRSRAPWHLLLVYEEGTRDEGETIVGDLPASTLRTLRGKLVFVPAGQDYREWQHPRVRSRVICLYFDPAKMPTDPAAGPAAAWFPPRLFFENKVVWETAVKLAAAIEDGAENERYCEALGVVIAHELLRMNDNGRRREPPARGGLAAWQQRSVAAYIEEHLAEPIPLEALAKLVRLSTYYFCRAFKQSFGIPPHRYHINRRIERAKALLAAPGRSVTEIALALGFCETSSFSAAFRQSTGITPTDYRRTLG